MMEIRLKSAYLEPLFVCLCLLTVLRPANGETVVRVNVGSEAVLPCFIRPERNITQDVFEWKKVVQKDEKQEVFMYNKGQHYNNGLTGQDQQFKGRVSHFQDQLQSGNASIVIRDTKLSDSGTYTCDFSPDDFDRQTFNIELDVVAVVRVTEESEAVLPCFIRPERDITQDLFDWKKDGQKEVFFYERGKHYNNGREGQDEQFKGRVSHFQDQLQFSNASIVIRDTKLSDSGTYTCDFPLLQPKGQKFYIELVVVACPKPQLTTSKPTKGLVRLQCEVQGVSLNHKIEVKDSDGNILSAEGTHTESEGSYKIILNTTVTKTGNYSCVVTQEEICHRTSDEISVNVPGACPKPSVTTLEATRYRVILKCEVQGVSPNHKVEMKDSDGNILSAEETHIIESGGSYDIILQTTVTETDNYYCVVTQEEICHQVSAETFVYVNDPEPPEGSVTGPVVGAVLGTLFFVGVILAVLYKKRYISITYQRVPQTETERDEEKNPTESVELNKKPDTSSQMETEKDEEKNPTESVELNKKPDTSELQ